MELLRRLHCGGEYHLNDQVRCHKFHWAQGKGVGSELNRGTPTPQKPNSVIIPNATHGSSHLPSSCFEGVVVIFVKENVHC